MIVNAHALHTIYVGFKTVFTKAFGEAKSFWQRIATEVTSETGEEEYGWLGDFPAMREWIGDRQIKNLTAHEYTIKNKNFESTVAVDRNAIEDDRMGVYTPQIQSLAQSAAVHPDQMVFGILGNGFTAKCYDGKPFFSQEHKMGKSAISNMGTAPLSMESYVAARSAMMSLKNEGGASLNLVPDLLVVPPALEAKGREILLADQINGSTNIYKGTAELLVVPYLSASNTHWFLLDTTRPLKPLIHQSRKKAQFVALDKEDDANVFMKRKFIYGVDARGNAGYGFWQMAWGSTGKG